MVIMIVNVSISLIRLLTVKCCCYNYLTSVCDICSILIINIVMLKDLYFCLKKPI